jgi:hypothetical protein
MGWNKIKLREIVRDNKKKYEWNARRDELLAKVISKDIRDNNLLIN